MLLRMTTAGRLTFGRRKLLCRCLSIKKNNREASIQSPDRSILIPGFQPTAYSSNGDIFMGTTYLNVPPKTLPVLDAAVILDPKSFCRRSSPPARTISGGSAAKRLIKGRQQFTDTLHGELEKQDVCHIFSLEGHGVPPQLFTHLLESADLLLGDNWSELLISKADGDLCFESVAFKEEEGITYNIIFKPYELELWTTAMHRMTSLLNFLLSHEKLNVKSGVLKNWQACIQKKAFVPPTLVEREELPIVEWKPQRGVVGGGKVSITLQRGKGLGMRFTGCYSFWEGSPRALNGTNNTGGFIWG